VHAVSLPPPAALEPCQDADTGCRRKVWHVHAGALLRSGAVSVAKCRWCRVVHCVCTCTDRPDLACTRAVLHRFSPILVEPELTLNGLHGIDGVAQVAAFHKDTFELRMP
jgi:hypothetical protein